MEKEAGETEPLFKREEITIFAAILFGCAFEQRDMVVAPYAPLRRRGLAKLHYPRHPRPRVICGLRIARARSIFADDDLAQALRVPPRRTGGVTETRPGGSVRSPPRAPRRRTPRPHRTAPKDRGRTAVAALFMPRRRPAFHRRVFCKLAHQSSADRKAAPAAHATAPRTPGCCAE